MIHEAAFDFFWLLNRGYPRESALIWVGNRYALSAGEREILRRGVVDGLTADKRLRKKVREGPRPLPLLEIDGHNVHITVESAIAGRLLVHANDGALRDTAGRSRRFRIDPYGLRVIELTADFFRTHVVAERLAFYFDAPMSRSGELACRYREALKEVVGEVFARAVDVPERCFDYAHAVVAGSDGEVMDRSRQWMDLAWEIIAFHGLGRPRVDFSSLR